MVPLERRTVNWTPCQVSNPARVTTKLGKPNFVTKKPFDKPIAAATATPIAIELAGDQPLDTFKLIMIEAASPLTTPTDKSISPISNIKTEPVAINARGTF